MNIFFIAIFFSQFVVGTNDIFLYYNMFVCFCEKYMLSWFLKLLIISTLMVSIVYIHMAVTVLIYIANLQRKFRECKFTVCKLTHVNLRNVSLHILRKLTPRKLTLRKLTSRKLTSRKCTHVNLHHLSLHHDA